MRKLPREVDPVVYNMLKEDPGNVSYTQVRKIDLFENDDDHQIRSAV